MPAKKKTETVKVRIAVLVGLDGNWDAIAVSDPDKLYSQADRDNEALDECAYNVDQADAAAAYIVTAELAVPKPKPAPEVEGTVEKPAEPAPKPTKKKKGRK